MFLGILSIYQIITGLIGGLVLFLIFWEQQKFIKKKLNDYNHGSSGELSFFYTLFSYIIVLTSGYYILGINKEVLSALLVVSYIPIIFSYSNYHNRMSVEGLHGLAKKILEEFVSLSNNSSSLIMVVLVVFLYSYFYHNPILNGSPTPWINVHWLVFIIFFCLSLNFVLRTVNNKNNNILNLMFLFLVISLIGLKYPLTFGFDTLLHQAALKYISEHGQILPLTPFYIGQYVLEVLIHYFTNWNFVFIERWFMPIQAVLIFYTLGKYFLQKNSINILAGIVPMAVLFMIPSQFIYTSPYAFSLLLAVVSVSALFVYFRLGFKSDYYFATMAMAASFLVHPFIGLNILPWILVAPWLTPISQVKRKRLLAIITSLSSSALVVVCFGVYNWLRGSEVFLTNPLSYYQNFILFFSDPTWYLKASTTFSVWLLYFYEKVSFVLVILILTFASFIKDKKITNNIFYFFTIILWLAFFYSQAQFIFIFLSILIYFFINRRNTQFSALILLISLSALISAYLFFSVIEVSGYSNGDQINYTSRLLQTAKWFLWPAVLLVLGEFFYFVSQKEKIYKIIFSVAIAGALTANWYLTYPRNDSISHININNLRAIDYQAIEYINKQENGKEGYLVLANQLFAGGAIQKYGFGPYYDSLQGKIFYYSVPMGGEMNKNFEKIMSLENYDPSIINKIFKDTGLNKIYFITADYWPLAPNAERQIKAQANQIKNFDNKITVYLFINEK